MVASRKSLCAKRFAVLELEEGEVSRTSIPGGAQGVPLAPTRTGTLTRVRHDRGDKGIADELALQMLGHVLDELRFGDLPGN